MSQKYFNAPTMVSLPLCLNANVFEGKYTRCKAMLAGEDEQAIGLLFMMTEDNYTRFEEFLCDIKGVFRLE